MNGGKILHEGEPGVSRRFALAASLFLLGATTRAHAAMSPEPLAPIPIRRRPQQKRELRCFRARAWLLGLREEMAKRLCSCIRRRKPSASGVISSRLLAKAGYRVVAYSRRGYGGSDPVPKDNPGTAAGDLQNLADFLGLKKFHLIGSAQAVASPWITRIRTRTAPQSRDRLRHRPPSRIRIISSSPRGCAPRGLTRCLRRSRTFTRISRHKSGGTEAWATLEHSAITGNRVGQPPANRIDWASFTRLKVPTLVIGGDSDLAVPPPMLRLYASHIPGAEVVSVPEAGHSLYWERPEIFNRALLAFFAKHRG